MGKLTLVLMVLAGSVSAQEFDVSPLGKLDLGRFVSSLHPALQIDQHVAPLVGIRFPLRRVHDAQGRDLFSLDGGGMWQVGGPGTGGLGAQVTVRADTVFGYLARKGMIQKHVTSSALVDLEYGPFVGYYQRRGWTFGVGFSMAFNPSYGPFSRARGVEGAGWLD